MPATRNLTIPALILGLALVLTAAILVVGLYYVLHSVADRAESIAQQHQQVIQDTGNRVDTSLQQGSDQLAASLETEIDRLGTQFNEILTEPVTVNFQQAVPIDHPIRVALAEPIRVALAEPIHVAPEQPLIIQGSESDRALNINASIIGDH